MANYCLRCGGQLSASGVCSCQSGGWNAQSGMGNSSRTTNVVGNGNVYSGKYSDCIVDPAEKVIGYLSDGAAKTFFTGGGLGSNKLFFTNKRLYIKTNKLSLMNGLRTFNYNVDLKDITALSIIHVNPIQVIVFGIIATIFGLLTNILAGIILAIISTVIYFLTRGDYLSVSCAGGTTTTSVKMYSYTSVMDFVKNLRRHI